MSDRAAILDQLTENHVIAAGWAEALRSVDPEIDRRIDACLTRLATAGPYLPARANLWRAFEVPLKDVRVLILGQDPYPNPQHAVGLSFSTGPQGPIPASLHNIYRNLEQCGYPPPADGDLSAWTEQGVMLLNRALTVPLNVTARPRRHLRWWAPVIIPTMKAIAVEAAERPVAALLWGAAAHRMRHYLEPSVKVFAASHPSPQSVNRRAGAEGPFRDARPCADVNKWFVQGGAPEVDWALAGPEGAGT
ncbi:uracil-DNA glycosylase [Dermatophilaceae bacterium Soc4.6]